MVRRFAALAIALAGVSFPLHAQTLPGAPVRPVAPVNRTSPPPRSGSIVLGQVVDAASGRPVPRAIVRLSFRGTTHTRVADDLGRFYFVNIPEADVQIVAMKAGFFDGAYGKRSAGGTGIPLTVSNNLWFPDVRIEMFKAAAISGIVSDEGNDPLAGIRVRAWRREFVEGRAQLIPVAETLTADDGSYRLFDLMPGEYIISVPSVQVTLPLAAVESAASSNVAGSLSALLRLNGGTAPEDRLVQTDGKNVVTVGRSAAPPQPDGSTGYAYQTEFYPGAEAPKFAVPVTVGPSEDRIGVHLQLRLVPAHKINGTVTGPDGPVPQRLVRLLFADSDDQGFGTEVAATITNADGTFTMLNVPDGRYTLQVREVGGLAGATVPVAPTSAPIASGAKIFGQADVVVSNRDVENVIVAVRSPPTLKGRILIETSAQRRSTIDPSRIQIALLPEQRAVGAALVRVPRADGTFEFSELAPGAYFVRVGAAPPGWSLKSIKVENKDLLDRPIDLDDDAEVTITLTDRAAEIWGTARDARGAPAVGATILLLPPATSGAQGLNPNRLRETRAATSGVFSLGGLPAGEYFVVAVDDTQAEGWQDPARIDALRAAATRVSVGDGEQKMVDLRLIRR